jgi:hypothetical protein
MKQLYISAVILLLNLATVSGGERVKVRDKTKLGIQGTSFTLNGRPTFLLGMSYYAALGAANETRDRDLAELKRRGFNWIRLWATWAAFENDVSAVDANGRAREEYLTRLLALVIECDRLGIVVDVSLSRGNAITGRARLQSLEAHQRAVETLVGALKPYQNWYLDLSNERNVKDKRFTSFADLKVLRERVLKLDPDRLVTASHGGDISQAEVKEYVLTVGVDFLSPHRPRQAASPKATEEMTRKYLSWTKEFGRLVPVHFQEPFRRGYGKWQPQAEDYKVDLKGALAGGAAGWCFHNGDQRESKDNAPRRSFDLRQKGLFEQLDDEETAALKAIQSMKISER